MKTFTITFKKWNGKTGKEETISQAGYASSYNEMLSEAVQTFGHLLVSVK